MQNDLFYTRYQRHLQLEGFGIEAQERLQKASILVIGCGGLGCPALLYLVSSGIGSIGIVDYDLVDVTNLHRQILFNEKEIGKPKVLVAEKLLKEINPAVVINTYNEKITNKNAFNILEKYDLVLDCTDNFTSRFLINDACTILAKPLIYAGVYRYEVQVAIWNVTTPEGVSANFRDLFQEDAIHEVPSCNETGVLSVVPGVAGMMMASECIKFIAGIGEPLINHILIFNILTNQFHKLSLVPKSHSASSVPFSRKDFEEKDYGYLSCSNSTLEISVEEFDKLRDQPGTTVVDVRELNEVPEMTFSHIKIPVSEIEGHINQLSVEKRIICICKTGVRSRMAASKFAQQRFEVYSLKGGITDWLKHHQSKES